ncbi:DNA starvation/stationary phase protection protein [Kocuria flava]|uniref:DNA protection during starvation protein n=1 Tax=Kocuria flava TaxID=446860 RepID=A0A0U2YUR5_9MICC|nr:MULTISPECIES: DNA starvation/stationary phase protection protein [Kocuria]ALU39281.1 DNA starvation/stationary phase protection protein [Kocuria flava]MCD1146058.1 DNA starvation/stationary phase protection protein [Kocuria sp. LUK]PLC11095.1 DNA starvation/stationary phase protection protein [Kocuria flava]GEO93834.1 DNA protection during starvation protein [Kocuria flava]
MAAQNQSSAPYTVPGLTTENGHEVARTLQTRLHALNDLQLTLKHAHWNVVGPNFIAVHEMLDPQIELVRGFVDELAERMATMGVAPSGLPGDLVAVRTWDDYSVGRATSVEHLAALDVVYNGVVADHREAIGKVGELDPVTEDILIGQVRELELFQWFMRAHLENSGGALEHGGETTEQGAASAAR